MPFLENVRYNDCFTDKWIQYLSPPEWRDRVTVEYVWVPIAAVEHAGCLTDPDVVQGWRDTIEDGKPVPPPVATLSERGTYYLHDGNHRFEALSACLPMESMVRIALVTPRPGYCFAREQHEAFASYVLRSRATAPKAIKVLSAAVFASALAILLTRMLPGTETSPFFVLLMASVVICARWFGWVAGITAAVVNAVCAAYFLLPPVQSIWIDDAVHLVQFVITAVAMLLVALAMIPNDRLSNVLDRVRR
jgi:hypothetical protein